MDHIDQALSSSDYSGHLERNQLDQLSQMLEGCKPSSAVVLEQGRKVVTSYLAANQSLPDHFQLGIPTGCLTVEEEPDLTFQTWS